MISTFILNINGHVFDCSYIESVKYLLDLLPRPIDPSVVKVFEWNDSKAEYESRSIEEILKVYKKWNSLSDAVFSMKSLDQKGR